MKRIIVEVGSSCTKIDEQKGNMIRHLEDFVILFKKNYIKENQLKKEDIQKLIEKIKELKKKTDEVYVCGTSIFRTLKKKEEEQFLEQFKKETQIDFHIISQEKENELTVQGITRNLQQEKVAILVGGGGSTEIAVYKETVQTMVNTPIGVVDVLNQFPDLSEDHPKTSLEEVKNFIKQRMQLPKEQADILVLGGGGHLYFALNSGFHYEKNDLYLDSLQPIKMHLKMRQEDTKEYFEKTSLDEIRKRVENPKWWFATRPMTAFVLVVAEAIGAKYIIPTNISMVYGLIEEWEKERK